MRCESCGARGAGNFCGECGTAIPQLDGNTSTRSGWRTAGVLLAVFTLGLALPIAFVRSTGADRTAAGYSLGPTATATLTATATATVIRKVRVTATATVTEQPDAPVAVEGENDTVPSPRPRGTLLVQAGPERGFGQTFPSGRCAVWQTGFTNQSDTAIDQITVAPPGGDWTKDDWNGHDYPTRAAAKPAPAVLDVYIAPGQETALEYRTCTNTPSPGPRFEYGAFAPNWVTFRWESGATGRACFKC